MQRRYFSSINESSPHSLHIALWIHNKLIFVRSDTKLQLIRVFNNVSEANFLRIIVAVDRISLIVAPIADITLSQLLHGFGIYDMSVFMPQILHNVRQKLISSPLKVGLNTLFRIIITLTLTNFGLLLHCSVTFFVSSW